MQCSSPVSGPRTYSTSFPATENPISESGNWVNGLAVGLDWQNMQTGSGNVYATATNPSNLDDNIAVLAGFAANHSIEAVVHLAGGYAPTDPHEIELILRGTITANSIKCYEILMDTAGSFQQVRWNGTIADITVNPPWTSVTGTGPGTVVDGDVIKAQISGDTITLFKNGSQVWQGTDATAGKITSGNPGVASFMRGTGNVLSSFGFKSIVATDL
jgi:hypothetical protein